MSERPARLVVWEDWHADGGNNDDERSRQLIMLLQSKYLEVMGIFQRNWGKVRRETAWWFAAAAADTNIRLTRAPFRSVNQKVKEMYGTSAGPDTIMSTIHIHAPRLPPSLTPSPTVLYSPSMPSGEMRRREIRPSALRGST